MKKIQENYGLEKWSELQEAIWSLNNQLSETRKELQKVKQLSNLAKNWFGDLAAGNYSEFLLDGVNDGFLTFNGTARPWDDIQVDVSLARYPAASSPTWRTFNYGVGGGIAYPALGFAVNDYFEFFIQTSHSMELNSVIDNHIHWTIPSDNAGDNIKFQLDVIAAGIDVDFAVPAGSPFTNEYTLVGNESGRHKLLQLANIPAINSTVSSVYICRLTRIASTAPSYGNEVYVTFNDSHYIKDMVGSREEDAK